MIIVPVMATRLTCPIWIVPFTSLFSRVFWLIIICLIVTICKTSKSPVVIIIVIVCYMRFSWQLCCLRLVFYWRLSKISSNERRRCICNVFSHWLRPYSAIDRKKNQDLLWRLLPIWQFSSQTSSFQVFLVRNLYLLVNYPLACLFFSHFFAFSLEALVCLWSTFDPWFLFVIQVEWGGWETRVLVAREVE